jgi:NADPH:quinone reductase-like Zn-dependent oxidoreductase
MKSIKTDAWVLEAGPLGTDSDGPGQLVRRTFCFDPPDETEVLAEPLYGCWEGNMTHALARAPVDICRMRREPEIVLGNSGIVRVTKVGKQVEGVAEGDICGLMPAGKLDAHGYFDKIIGYDAVGSMGLLAKQVKLPGFAVVPLPKSSGVTLKQWACTSIRYGTAWSNWKAAYGCWKVMAPAVKDVYVLAWGGGTAFAELTLAKQHGCHVAMVCSSDARASYLRANGIHPIDRREFSGLSYDAQKIETDRAYRHTYRKAEAVFLRRVRELTDDAGASIFVDNVGEPVSRATLLALGRPGVLTTVGWMGGTNIAYQRPIECMARRVHVHTHATRMDEALESIDAIVSGWVPPLAPDEPVCDFDDIPELAQAALNGTEPSYFPLYRVNAV